MNIGQGDLCLLLQVIWESTLPDIYYNDVDQSFL